MQCFQNIVFLQNRPARVDAEWRVFLAQEGERHLCGFLRCPLQRSQHFVIIFLQPRLTYEMKPFEKYVSWKSIRDGFNCCWISFSIYGEKLSTKAKETDGRQYYLGNWRFLQRWLVVDILASKRRGGGSATCAASKISTKCPESPLQQLWRMCGHDIRSTIRANLVINFLLSNYSFLCLCAQLFVM